jgi:hypothetical protein
MAIPPGQTGPQTDTRELLRAAATAHLAMSDRGHLDDPEDPWVVTALSTGWDLGIAARESQESAHEIVGELITLLVKALQALGEVRGVAPEDVWREAATWLARQERAAGDAEDDSA